MTAQKLGAVWVFLFHQNGFKSCICMENARNGLLIGPKIWDRIMEIFLDFLDSRDSGCGLLGALYHNLFNKLCFGVYKIGNG